MKFFELPNGRNHLTLKEYSTVEYRNDHNFSDRSGQIVQTQIRLLLEEQSDQSLHCLLFDLHLFSRIP